MGGGSYSSDRRAVAAAASGFKTKSAREIFRQRTINSAMNPYDVKLRESRDSEEHPNSVAIVLALDVTGSMGGIPHHLVKEGLPHIMENIIAGGIKDPQLLFMGIGDHEHDDSPLQVGQFESSDPLLDKWLTDIYLEGGGGANKGESYFLAWHFAGMHTSIDCFEKRSQKGFLFTIGDEPVLDSIPKREIESIMGPGQHEDFSAMVLLDKAREMYDVYHIHIKEGSNGRKQSVMDGWSQIMGDNLIIIDDYRDVPKTISDIVSVPSDGEPVISTQDFKDDFEEEEIIL